MPRPKRGAASGPTGVGAGWAWERTPRTLLASVPGAAAWQTGVPLPVLSAETGGHSPLSLRPLLALGTQHGAIKSAISRGSCFKELNSQVRAVTGDKQEQGGSANRGDLTVRPAPPDSQGSVDAQDSPRPGSAQVPRAPAQQAPGKTQQVPSTSAFPLLTAGPRPWVTMQSCVTAPGGGAGPAEGTEEDSEACLGTCLVSVFNWRKEAAHSAPRGPVSRLGLKPTGLLLTFPSSEEPGTGGDKNSWPLLRQEPSHLHCSPSRNPGTAQPCCTRGPR